MLRDGGRLVGLGRLVGDGALYFAITDVVIEAMTSSRPKTRYAIPNQQLMGWVLPRVMPDRWLDQMIAKQLGLNPKDG